MEICAICNNETDDTTKYILPECGHVFHTNCLIPWLCVNYGRCSECERHAQALYEERRNKSRIPRYRDFKYASSQARRKNAPREIARLYSKYKRHFRIYNEQRALSKAFNTDRMELYRNLRREYYKRRSSLRRAFRNVSMSRRELCQRFPIQHVENTPAFTEMALPTFCESEPIIIQEY